MKGRQISITYSIKTKHVDILAPNFNFPSNEADRSGLFRNES